PPAIVVSVSASTGIDAYRNRDYCWIRNATTQMWFFVGPIIFIVAWNVVVVVAAIRSLFSIKAMVRKSEIQKFKVGIKAVTSLVFLFGISWIFGILYYATNHIVLAYLFTLLNCPQGLLIFYFHCFRDREIQDYMRKKFKLSSMIFPMRSNVDCSRDIRLGNTRFSHTTKISVRPISPDNASYECKNIGGFPFSHNKTAAVEFVRKDSSNSATTLLSACDNPALSVNNMTDAVSHL
ncbi:Adhesion G-protein coupled receptor D1, partial [Trichoplax sp. H2]